MNEKWGNADKKRGVGRGSIVTKKKTEKEDYREYTKRKRKERIAN